MVIRNDVAKNYRIFAYLFMLTYLPLNVNNTTQT